MRRSRLLVALVVIPCAVSAATSAFAQQVLQPYSEPVLSPYADEPGPGQPLPAVPPPVVAPPPGYNYGYQQQYPQQQYPQQPYYGQPQPMYYPQQQPLHFHEEMQPRYGLMVAGLVVFGVSWSINAATAYAADEWRLAVPVIGPFMETSQINTSSGYEYNRALVGLLVFDGLIETAGAVMLVAGAVTKQKVRIYDRGPAGPQVSVVPTASPGMTGVAAFGRF
ncbi:MAG: hypothetical protein JWN44_6304 [Myxococcales bacterium]|nr:hypothetical protein [Myxococcales bacterium]